MNIQFQPIRLLAPDPTEWDRVRQNLSGATREIEVAFRFSSKPADLWRGLFLRGWEMWYPRTAPPTVTGDYLIVTCTPSQLVSRIEMAKVMIEEANHKSAPLIRGQAAQTAVERKRREKLELLAMEHEKPITVPNTRGGDILIDMMLQKQAKDRDDAEKEIALVEFDAALTCLADADLTEALSKL